MIWTSRLEAARRALAASHPDPDLARRAGTVGGPVGVTLPPDRREAVAALRTRCAASRHALARDFLAALGSYQP